MKKHLFTLVLALLFAALASAAVAQDYYTLPEIREQAAQGWHQTYTDKYGRTRRVDVDIEVFGEETAPVLKACWGTKDFRAKAPSGDPGDPIIEARMKGTGIETYLYEEVPYMKVILDEAYGGEYGNALTLHEAYDFFDGLFQEQGKSLYKDCLWEQPRRFSVIYSANEKTGDVLVPAMYSIRLCQREFGLPLLTHVGTSFQKLNVAFTCPGLIFNIRDRESYSYVNADFDIAEILTEDIPLCSVDKVIEGAREMIESGYVHDVLALRFGYVVYSDPNVDWTKGISCGDVDTWYLMPSWVLDCHVLWNPKEDDPEKSYHMQIAINAQTGEMMDYFDKSLNKGGDVRFKGFISWDSVK